ncbi:hypothetical protein BU23DRAFT_284992 [Bimuria novae-zelandiae CBS 107.79]|uniref:Xylanolytic transcriptional activator regulatory domain-containing protein n=1 Tax=Bimuria novae-zelandiae CBS 107.79 TaxID=1447943 RepID=A0A6A5USW7_9PLEO|nr:hypothetical protein BU23DRAFT_284992 [Bimuria novae-zelandiae CBS 107.79]
MIPQSLRNRTYRTNNNTTTAGQGRLTVDSDGKSHYINSEKNKQVSYFETVLASDTAANTESSGFGQPIANERPKAPNTSALLAAPTDPKDLRTLYPPLQAIPKLWDYYTQHVDNMLKVIYKPDVARIIADASKGLRIGASEETLLFAIWYAAIASSTSETCQALYGIGKKPLVHKYRASFEQALKQANWLSTQEVTVLQSLAIYLVFAQENSRSTWMICGISISLAQAVGLHMEDHSFPFTPVETEVRRRVWWSLAQIDVRVSENCGLEPHIPLVMSAPLPLHVNDIDIEPNIYGQCVLPRDELTEMTLTLIKIEMTQTKLRFKRAHFGPSTTNEEKDAVINEQIQRYREVYFKYFTDTSEFSRVCALGLRLLMARLWKLMYDGSRSQEPEDKDVLDEPLLRYNADVLEISHQLPNRYRQFGWFFRCKYTQWHALAYLLVQLCKHTSGPAVDRAWEVINAFFGTLEEHNSLIARGFINIVTANKKNSLWQPLLVMLLKAQASRRKALQTPKRTADTPSTLESDSNTTATTPNETLGESEPSSWPISQDQEGILGDAFLGQSLDFGEEMNWEQIDAWVDNFQAGIARESGMLSGEQSALGALDWS